MLPSALYLPFIKAAIPSRVPVSSCQQVSWWSRYNVSVGSVALPALKLNVSCDTKRKKSSSEENLNWKTVEVLGSKPGLKWGSNALCFSVSSSDSKVGIPVGRIWQNGSLPTVSTNRTHWCQACLAYRPPSSMYKNPLPPVRCAQNLCHAVNLVLAKGAEIKQHCV